MMKFRPNNEQTYRYIKQELQKNGYNCVRADDKEWSHITDTSFNPMAVLYCCKYGLALFDEAEKDSAYNPNVAYELGMMQCQNKRCLILKHESLPNPPFDIVKDLYQTYSKEIEFEEILRDWLQSLKD